MGLMHSLRSVWMIAKSVLIEAVRRKEIYAIVLITLLLIGAVMTVNFFNLEGVEKFYREIALKVMGVATGLTVIVLSARQLPREFQNRTIYPLMAKPIGRMGFLFGKLFGVMLAASFCFAMFMCVYLAGALFLGHHIPWTLFIEHIYLQLLMMLILATLSFWLSMLVNLDAAISIGVIFFLLSATLSHLMSQLYNTADSFGKTGMVVLNYSIPHLTLFDLSGKVVHSTGMWSPVGLGVMAKVSLYGLFWAALYFGLALAWFRKKEL